MSKSKGPLLTMKRAVNENGADVTRLYILYSAEYDNDADWRRKEVEAMKRHLERFYELVRENYTKEIKEIDHLDRWLMSRFQKAVKDTREAMEKLQTRRAVNSAFFEVMNDVRWYLKRGGDNLAIILDDWIKLLTPFIPHICEELWHIKHDSFVSLESYPEYDESKVDEVAEAIENYLKALIEDIKEVMKFSEGKNVYLAFAEDWKVQALKIALKSESMKSAMAELMRDEKFKRMAKEVSAFLKRVFRDKDTFKEIAKIDERKIVEENREFVERELGVKLILDEKSVPNEKRKLAMPGKPAIYVA